MFRFLSSARGKLDLHSCVGGASFSSVQLFQRSGIHLTFQHSVKAKVTPRISTTLFSIGFCPRQCFSTLRNNLNARCPSLNSSKGAKHPGRTLAPLLNYSNQHSSAKHILNRKCSGVQSQFRNMSRSSSYGKTQSSFSSGKQRKFRGAAYAFAAIAVGAGVYLLHSFKYQYNSLQSACQAEAEVPVRKDERKLLGPTKSVSLQEAVAQATDLCQRVMDETGSPGLVVAVSVDGKQVWSQGFGYADIENRLPCKPESVMRIASISKSITMAAVAKAVENGDLDLDKPVQFYVPNFPQKKVNGDQVTMTTRQLVSHLSGVRHYSKKYMKDNSADATTSAMSASPKNEGVKETTESAVQKKGIKKSTEGVNVAGEFAMDEYYIKDKFDSTEAALALFKDDPLVHKPGEKYLYSTHAWTLVAAVLEGATKQKFPVLMRQLFYDLGLDNTHLDENEPLIYNRARYYCRNKKGLLINAPYVDCSYKYAGGGFLSSVGDLLRFGNAMLYSYQHGRPASGAPTQEAGSNTVPQNGGNTSTTQSTNPSGLPATSSSQHRLPGYLKQSTIQQMWAPCVKMPEIKDAFYAMGWKVVPEKQITGMGRRNRQHIFHTGGAVGASSVLLILPSGGDDAMGKGDNLVSAPPRGVCVAIIVNMISVGVSKTGLQIARLFEGVTCE